MKLRSLCKWIGRDNDVLCSRFLNGIPLHPFMEFCFVSLWISRFFSSHSSVSISKSRRLVKSHRKTNELELEKVIDWIESNWDLKRAIDGFLFVNLRRHMIFQSQLVWVTDCSFHRRNCLEGFLVREILIQAFSFATLDVKASKGHKLVLDYFSKTLSNATAWKSTRTRRCLRERPKTD